MLLGPSDGGLLNGKEDRSLEQEFGHHQRHLVLPHFPNHYLVHHHRPLELVLLRLAHRAFHRHRCQRHWVPACLLPSVWLSPYVLEKPTYRSCCSLRRKSLPSDHICGWQIASICREFGQE